MRSASAHPVLNETSVNWPRKLTSKPARARPCHCGNSRHIGSTEISASLRPYFRDEEPQRLYNSVPPPHAFQDEDSGPPEKWAITVVEGRDQMRWGNSHLSTSSTVCAADAGQGEASSLGETASAEPGGHAECLSAPGSTLASGHRPKATGGHKALDALQSTGSLRPVLRPSRASIRVLTGQNARMRP